MRRFFPQRVFPRLLIVSLTCVALPLFGAGVVTNASQASLQAAMATGGTVELAFNGTIALTNTIVVATNTVLVAPEGNVTISGSNTVQLFIVPESVSLVLSNLILANGFALGAGGAISNLGTVQAIGCLFTNNGADGPGPDVYPYISGLPGQGGAIYNAGTLLVTNCSFLTNWAEGGAGQDAGVDFVYAVGGGGNGNGGAIYNINYAMIDNCVFNSNSAVGGAPGAYQYSWEQAGGLGVVGADVNGGAIYNSSSLSITSSTFAANDCIAGLGGDAVYNYEYFSEGGPGYAGGAGGNASGAGLFSVSGNVFIVGTTFFDNFVLGAAGGAGSSSAPGSAGGPGGPGGQAVGGSACFAAGTLRIVNCTFGSNVIVAGAGGAGSSGLQSKVAGGNGGNGGNATGGAICVLGGVAYLTNATFAGNVCQPGRWGQGGPGDPPAADGINGVPEGDNVAVESGVLTLVNSLLSCAPGDTNIFGAIIDAGYNVSSDASGFLTNSTSLNGADPGLGTLGNYGGPTPTIPLLPGSIALDHANPTSFPPTDQRGYPRPFGSGPDVGAFEYWPSPPNSLTITAAAEQMLDLEYWGLNGQSFRTLESSNLLDWFAIATNAIAQSNSFELRLPMSNSIGAFFQAVSP